MRALGVFVLQHLWSHWTKATRKIGGRQAAHPEALPLLTPKDTQSAWVHSARRLEREGFNLVENAEPLTLEGWRTTSPAHPANLEWRLAGEAVHIFLSPPWPGLLRTAWPNNLENPLLILQPGDIAKVNWNARFASALEGYDRDFFLAEHCYWLANVAEAKTDLFLSATPSKHIDLRTCI